MVLISVGRDMTRTIWLLLAVLGLGMVFAATVVRPNADRARATAKPYVEPAPPMCGAGREFKAGSDGSTSDERIARTLCDPVRTDRALKQMEKDRYGATN